MSLQLSERVKSWRKTAFKHRDDAAAIEAVSLPYAIYAWQQASETALKCAILATGTDFPAVHNLLPLWKLLGEQIDLPEMDKQTKEDMRNLTILNTASRYPVGDQSEAHFESLTDLTLDMAKRTGGFIFTTLEDVMPDVFEKPDTGRPRP